MFSGSDQATLSFIGIYFFTYPQVCHYSFVLILLRVKDNIHLPATSSFFGFCGLFLANHTSHYVSHSRLCHIRVVDAHTLRGVGTPVSVGFSLPIIRHNRLVIVGYVLSSS